MAFQVKAIIPPRLNPEVFEAEIERELERQGEIIRRLYEKTVATWSSPKPKFKLETLLESPGPRGGRTSKAASVEVSTDDDRFIWTDLGTRPHPITARRAPYLVFRWPYGAKTRRRVLGSRQARRGRNWASKRRIRHPGTRARLFTDEIEKRRRRPFFGGMSQAIDRATRRAFSGRRPTS